MLLLSQFLGGYSCQFDRQFGLTIAASVLLLAVTGLTMMPAQAGALSKHYTRGAHGAVTGCEPLPWWGP